MDMFFQAVFACTVALAAAAYNGPLAGGVPASLYPAGVSPQACPNYPNCANPAVAANPAAAAPYGAAPYAAPYGGYNPAPAYNPAPQYNAAPAYNGGYNQNALDSGEYTGDGDYHGEGLAESGAYGQQGTQLTLPLFKIVNIFVFSLQLTTALPVTTQRLRTTQPPTPQATANPPKYPLESTLAPAPTTPSATKSSKTASWQTVVMYIIQTRILKCSLWEHFYVK